MRIKELGDNLKNWRWLRKGEKEDLKAQTAIKPSAPGLERQRELAETIQRAIDHALTIKQEKINDAIERLNVEAHLKIIEKLINQINQKIKPDFHCKITLADQHVVISVYNMFSDSTDDTKPSFQTLIEIVELKETLLQTPTLSTVMTLMETVAKRIKSDANLVLMNSIVAITLPTQDIEKSTNP